MQVVRRELAPLRGARLRTTWVINPGVGDTAEKSVTIPHTIRKDESSNALRDEPAAHQVVGAVMAHQADDGYLV
jgi:hypothetical protein